MVRTPSLPGSDAQVGARLITPIPISVDASKDVFSGIVVRSWCEPWQARETTKEGGRGHAKDKSSERDAEVVG